MNLINLQLVTIFIFYRVLVGILKELVPVFELKIIMFGKWVFKFPIFFKRQAAAAYLYM